MSHREGTCKNKKCLCMGQLGATARARISSYPCPGLLATLMQSAYLSACFLQPLGSRGILWLDAATSTNWTCVGLHLKSLYGCYNEVTLRDVCLHCLYVVQREQTSAHQEYTVWVFFFSKMAIISSLGTNNEICQEERQEWQEWTSPYRSTDEVEFAPRPQLIRRNCVHLRPPRHHRITHAHTHTHTLFGPRVFAECHVQWS